MGWSPLDFCMLQVFLPLWSSSDFFQKTSFRNTIRVSDGLDSDQDQRFVGPDLSPNCLHIGYQQAKKKHAKLPSLQRVKYVFLALKAPTTTAANDTF